MKKRKVGDKCFCKNIRRYSKTFTVLYQVGNGYFNVKDSCGNTYWKLEGELGFLQDYLENAL